MGTTLTTDTVLNPALHQALVACFGRVRVAHAGEPRKVRYLPDSKRPDRLKAKVIQRGEQYVVNCPFCEDEWGRLYIDYHFGIPDLKTRSPNLHLFHCFNEPCHSRQSNWQRLKRMLQRCGYRGGPTTRLRPDSNDQERSQAAIEFPNDVVPLHQLEPSHPACEYLRGRGFDPIEIGVRWGVGYCADSPETSPPFKESLVIPIWAPASSFSGGQAPICAGWQARSIVDGVGRGRRYMAAAGFEKSRVLYGLPDALLTTGPLYICEGATDCWAIGPGAVAIFGKSASDKQRSLIEQHFSHRPIVIFPDRGAEAEAVDLRTYLQRRRDPTTTPPVVIAELPEHRDDPGECTRDEILGAAATALDVPGNEVAYASEIDIVNGRRHYLSERGADRVGSHVAVVYSTGSAGRANAALVGGDGKLRYVTPCTERFFLSLAPKPRVYHNAVTSRLRELQIGLPAPTAFEDLRVAGHLLDENCSCDLPDLCRRYVDEGSDGANGQDQLLPSASESDRRTSSDAIRLRRLWDEGQLLERLDQQDLRYVYDEIELPVADVTAAMMDNGIGVDAEWLQEHRDRWATEVEDLRREIESHSRHPVNVDDPASVSGLLQDLGLPLADATADAKCRTDKQTLLRIRDAHPVVRKILNYRRHKARHEWADRLLRKTHPRTGRLHFRLDPLGTVTGRFSCEDPNLQGLPADMREAFIPAPGLVLVEADFSQIELRVLAHISGDSRLLKAYRLDQADLHRKTAAAVFKISEKAVTAQQRALGKKVNFAIIYGMTPHGLAHDMNVDEDTARSFIQRFFEAYPQADRWIWACKREAESCGHVRSLYGRRRCLPNAQSETRADLERALRQATNFVIQGTAADINKMALIRLHKALPDDCRMLLTVHDSVLIEAPANRGCEVVPLIRQVMEESPPDFSVPLKVDVHVGQNWGKCK